MLHYHRIICNLFRVPWGGGGDRALFSFHDLHIIGCVQTMQIASLCIILNHDYSSSVQVFILIHCYYIHSLQSPNVDQQHVVIEFSESENCFVLQDLNTAQGTYVNDCRVQNAAVRLAPGDILRFGYGGPAYELTVESPEQVGVISSVSVTMTIRIAIIFLHNIGGVFLASRVPGCHLGTQILKNHPLGHQKDFVRNF